MNAMRKHLFLPVPLLLIGGLLAACAGKTPLAEPPVAISQLVSRVQEAVVTIRTFNPDMKPIGLGTGFFINDQGQLITTYHVLEGAYAATVKTREGQSYPVVSVLAERWTLFNCRRISRSNSAVGCMSRKRRRISRTPSWWWAAH